MALRGGRYERIRGIATGGMATVYLGRAHGHGVGGFQRPVAIKVMHEHLAKTSEFVAMFMDEARMAAGIRHPNVVATLDAVRDDEGLFLVLEYVEGLSVQHLIKGSRHEGSYVPMDITIRIVMDALIGLHAAHEHKAEDGSPLNLVHRDVSPANILVGTDGIARITDFGIARAESRAHVTRTGEVKGKIAYMSVEQIRSAKVDRRSDVYSASLILWELLAHRRCLLADSDGAAALLAAEGAKQSPRALNPSIPEPIAACCMKALSVGPDQRYATAAEFAEALEDAALDAGVRPAKPREVGEYVQRMVSVCGMDDLITGSAPRDAVAAARSVPSSRDPHATKPELAGPTSSPDLTPPPPSDGTPDVGSLPSASTKSATVLTPIPGLPGSGGRRNLIVGLSVGTAVFVGLMVLVFGVGGGETPTATQSESATTEVAAGRAAPATTSAAAPTPTQEVAAPTGAPDTPASAANASASASAAPVEVAAKKKAPESTATKPKVPVPPPPPVAPPAAPPPKPLKKPNWGY